ncbi:MAG: DUF2842 domain-containing protein [Sphingomonadaceae bacterium]
MNSPSLRKPLGTLAILVWISAWTIVALLLADYVLTASWFAQLVYFAVIGVIWIAPLKPVLVWMETGRFRP